MKVLKQLPLWVAYALIAYMPFHIFVAHSMGQLTGGLNAWKIGKDLVTIALLFLTIALVLINVKRGKLKHLNLIILLAVIYAVLHVITYLANKETDLDVAALAATYNNRFIWIFLIAAGCTLYLKKGSDSNTVIKLLLIVSTIVCLLGLAQRLLPPDILTHFGYSKELGVKPNFFINEDPAFPRVMSTIRDPNSLGAFLIVPILLLIQALQNKKSRNKMLIAGALLLHLLIMYLTFSRAAWGGLLIAMAIMFGLSHKQKTIDLFKQFWPAIIAVVILVSFLGYAVRDTKVFRSVVLRANDTNAVTELDSDDYHLHFIEQGIKGVVEEPLGHGPGTAGIVSIHNGAEQILTENYYIQIAYEVGIFGLIVFVTIWVLVIQLVYRARSSLSVVLVSAAAAYAVMALVMHLWTNEAVAFTWWGLAGFVLWSRYTPIKSSNVR